jgi:hypothetical protein
MKRIIDLEKDEEVNEAYWIAARGGIAGAARVRIRHTFCYQISQPLPWTTIVFRHILFVGFKFV